MLYSIVRLISKQNSRLLKNKFIRRYTIVNCLLVFSMFLFVLIVQPVAAQSNDNIDFEINDEKLSSALFRLAYVSDMNFTYDAGDSLFNTKLSYHATAKQPIVILEELLSSTNLTFKQVGNQVVIYKNKSNSINPVLQENTPVEENNNTELAVVATDNSTTLEVIRDTVFVSDTIFEIHTDTIRIIDTIFVEQEKPQKVAPQKIKEIPVDYFNPKASRESGWSAEIFFAPIASSFSLVRQTNSLSIRNFSFGVEASKILNKWNITGGLKLTHFAEKFNHTYSTSDGGYFVTDTIDEYYTVSETDTTYYYVTDSTWKPIDNHEYSYNINNQIGYIEFLVSVSYDYYTNRKLRLYAKAGMQTGALIYNRGLAIPDVNEPAGVDFADLKFSSMSYSILAGIGIKYRINEYVDFNSELYYFKNFNDVVVDYPVNNKIAGVGLKLGLIYYF